MTLVKGNDYILEGTNEGNAMLSPCEKYRYELERTWDRAKTPLYVIMLNPSTADAQNDDPTIRRVTDFARTNGYGGVRVYNLYAMRATNPDELLGDKDRVGPDNNQILRNMLAEALSRKATVLCAWGRMKQAIMYQARYVRRLVRESGVDAVCLGKNLDGSPKHPLYIRGDKALEDFD